MSCDGNMQAGIDIADRGRSEVDAQKGLLLGCQDLTSALTNDSNSHLHALSNLSAGLECRTQVPCDILGRLDSQGDVTQSVAYVSLA